MIELYHNLKGKGESRQLDYLLICVLSAIVTKSKKNFWGECARVNLISHAFWS